MNKNWRVPVSREDLMEIRRIMAKYLPPDLGRLMSEHRAKLICIDWDWVVLNIDYTRRTNEQVRKDHR